MKKLDLLRPRLAPRELDIVRLLAEGKTDREIAEKLGLTRKTVSNRLSLGIFPKLDVTKRVEAARWYFLDHSRQFPLDVEPQKAKGVNERFELRDHIGLWCARCVGYLEPHEVGTYHPYGRISSVDDQWLQVAVDKVLGWTVPVHRDGCPSVGIFLDVAAAVDRFNSLLLCSILDLENWANITFYQGRLIRNIVIRLILSHRCFDKGDEEGAAIELVKAAISNAGSSQSEAIGPILDFHMPLAVLNNLPYQKFRFLLALGNRARNIGKLEVAEKHFGRARHILSDMLPKKAKKPAHALERRELSVRQSARHSLRRRI